MDAHVLLYAHTQHKICNQFRYSRSFFARDLTQSVRLRELCGATAVLGTWLKKRLLKF